jgi:primosomal protein N' (replication factor Y)
MDTLFYEAPAESSPAAPAAPVGPFAVVALERAIDRVLDYSVPPRLLTSLRVGQRVRVPLGRRNKPATGYVVGIREATEHPKVKPLGELIDERVLVSPQMMELARWMGRYYVAPLGVVLESIIPSAVKKRIGLGYSSVVRAALGRAELQALFEKTTAPKRRSVLARLMQLAEGEPIELVRLAGEAGVTGPTVRKLVRLGVITIAQQPDLIGLGEDLLPPADHSEPDRTLNVEQQRAFDELRPRMDAGGFGVNLLLGVTGSGKTEVYLQCIRRVVAAGRQAIVLVPEIALTPQTVKRFVARFGRVAVLHSGLSAGERHRHWQRIASGGADVVVGARSAVFAPVPKLGVIVVDEEHEPSYKQDTAPRYHGRDVAIKRAQLEGVPVILGSATPSLETYHRVTTASSTPHSQLPTPTYSLLSLPTRVRNLQMPHVELLDMRKENKVRRGVHLLSQRLEHLLRTTIEKKQQAILLLNRRGYSNFVYCASCGDALQCKYCDATMTYHRSAGPTVGTAKLEAGLHSGQLQCHYCLASNPLPATCTTCGKKLSLFGLGTQRVEEELARKFPDLTFARVDSDTMRSTRDYEALLGRFARNEVQVMLGTQMIAKGLDYPNVTLVGVISGDTALALPDFRAAERTFQLITQVAGRAGRGDAPGRVVLQTFLPDDPTIQFAIKQDYVGFARRELALRREIPLPPFNRMVRIILRDQDAEKLHALGDTLAAAVNDAVAAVGDGVTVKGPMPCPISRIAGYFRNQIVLTSARANQLQRVLARVRQEKGLAKSDRIAVDVDPVSLL